MTCRPSKELSPPHGGGRLASSTPKLVEDVIALIVQECKFEIPTLRSLTLVSKSTRLIATPLLYHTLTINKAVSSVVGCGGFRRRPSRELERSLCLLPSLP